MKLELRRKALNRKQIIKELFKKMMFNEIVVDVWNFGKFVGTFDFGQQEIDEIKQREIKVFQRATRCKNARI